MNQNGTRQKSDGHSGLVRRLLLLTVLMFGFGFALVPLYDVFCQITGINGKVTNVGLPSQSLTLDTSRSINIELIASNNQGMPWQFRPEQNQVQLFPGEQRQLFYRVHNPTQATMVARAVPSVAPAEAAQYLHKINCFCFESQQLVAGGSESMPLVLMIDPELPEHIRTITLAYTLFDITDEQPLAQRLDSASAVVRSSYERL